MFFLKNSKNIDGKNLKYILKKSEKIIFFANYLFIYRYKLFSRFSIYFGFFNFF
jgi:hypothetical protein